MFKHKTCFRNGSRKLGITWHFCFFCSKNTNMKGNSLSRSSSFQHVIFSAISMTSTTQHWQIKFKFDTLATNFVMLKISKCAFCHANFDEKQVGLVEITFGNTSPTFRQNINSSTFSVYAFDTPDVEDKTDCCETEVSIARGSRESLKRKRSFLCHLCFLRRHA